MKQKQKINLQRGLLTLIISMASALYCMVLYLENAEIQYGSILFKNNTKTFVFVGILVFSALLLLPISWMGRQKKEESGHPVPLMASCLAGFFLIGCGIMPFILKPTPLYSPSGTAAIFVKLCIVFALLGSIYFLLPAFLSKYSGTLRTWFGLAVLLFLMSALLLNHYDMSVFLSSVPKISAMCSYSFLIFFFVMDLRTNLEAKVANQPIYIYLGLLSFFLTFTETVPTLILSFMRKGGLCVTLDTFFVLARCALGLYALVSSVVRTGEGREKEASDKKQEQDTVQTTDNEKGENEVMANEKMVALGEHRSVIRDLFEYGLQQKKLLGEENVFDFSLGNPSIPSPKKVNETLCNLIQNTDSTVLHGYSTAAGDVEVRKTLASYTNERFHTRLSYSDFYLTCGAAASLTISLHALLNEEEEVLVLAPFFPEYKVFIEKAGGVLRTVPATEPDFAPDLEIFKSLINEKTRAVIINSPNNPSGVVLKKEVIEEIAGILREAEERYSAPIYIIADEPYRELVYDDVEVPYLMNYYKDTLVCYSYSKSLSLPGERIGYIAVSNEAAEHEKVYAAICGAGRALGYVCAPVLFQKMLLQCYNESADISAYKENRDLLYRSLTEMGFTCVKPEGAFYLFVKAPGGEDQAFSDEAKKLNLLLVPSASFGMSGYVRIAYCVSKNTILRSLAAFKELAEKVL